MKCPYCEKEGKKSISYCGEKIGTYMGCDSFYDEDGKLHNHDLSIYTNSYCCSNGHKWSETESNECWCGWKNNE